MFKFEYYFYVFRIKNVVEINFLCVHKKLREKRVAPVLIREITRRVNLQGIFQAVYTAGVVLPKPVATCRYSILCLTQSPGNDLNLKHILVNMIGGSISLPATAEFLPVVFRYSKA